MNLEKQGGLTMSVSTTSGKCSSLLKKKDIDFYMISLYGT